MPSRRRPGTRTQTWYTHNQREKFSHFRVLPSAFCGDRPYGYEATGEYKFAPLRSVAMENGDEGKRNKSGFVAPVDTSPCGTVQLPCSLLQTGIKDVRHSMKQTGSTAGLKLVFYFPLFTSFVTLTLLALAISSGWFGPATREGTQYGEASRPGLIKQPINTYSNLGFVVIGLFIGWSLMREVARDKSKPLAEKAIFSSFFATLLVCVGPGSAALHATESRIGGDLDLLSMYFIAAFLIAYALKRLLGLGRIGFSLLFAGVVFLCFEVRDLRCSLPLMSNVGQFVFGFFVASSAVVEALNLVVRRLELDVKWVVLTLTFLTMAFAIWELSVHHAPSRSLVQGHALWHLLCAVSGYCMFRYYISEEPGPMNGALARQFGAAFTTLEGPALTLENRLILKPGAGGPEPAVSAGK